MVQCRRKEVGGSRGVGWVGGVGKALGVGRGQVGGTEGRRGKGLGGTGKEWEIGGGGGEKASRWALRRGVTRGERGSLTRRWPMTREHPAKCLENNSNGLPSSHAGYGTDRRGMAAAGYRDPEIQGGNW